MLMEKLDQQISFFLSYELIERETPRRNLRLPLSDAKEANYFQKAGPNPNCYKQTARIALERIQLNLHNSYRRQAIQPRHTQVLG